jgi:hypothetical protein
MLAPGATGAVGFGEGVMTMYRIVFAATLAAALASCGGNDEQAQAESPAIESTAPAGNAGPPPGAAPAPGVGDANSAPTSAPVEPIRTDGSSVAPDGTNATSPATDTTGDTTQGQMPQTQNDAASTGVQPTPPTQ